MMGEGGAVYVQRGRGWSFDNGRIAVERLQKFTTSWMNLDPRVRSVIIRNTDFHVRDNAFVSRLI